MQTVELPGSFRLLYLPRGENSAWALVSTFVDCETKNSGSCLPFAVIVNRDEISGSTVEPITTPFCHMSREVRRVCFPFSVASLSTDIFSVKEIFHFLHLPVTDKNATVIVQKYFYGWLNSS